MADESTIKAAREFVSSEFNAFDEACEKWSAEGDPRHLAIMLEKFHKEQVADDESKVAKEAGIRLACGMVDEMYGNYNRHPFMQGDCVLAKLNLLPKTKLRKNPRPADDENRDLRERLAKYEIFERSMTSATVLSDGVHLIEQSGASAGGVYVASDAHKPHYNSFLEAFEALTKLQEKL